MAAVPGEHPTVGIVSPGAMGSAVGRILVRRRVRVVATLAGRSDRTARFVDAAGIEVLPDLDSVVREAGVILSVAPPDQAEAIATDLVEAARRVATAPLVVDLNAISPATVERVGAILAGAGLPLVDASISGPPPRKSWTTRIYVSGQDAPRVAALPLRGVDVLVVGDEVGTASAVKMCTASMYKGSVALFTQALRTARAHGVVAHVLDDLASSFPQLVGEPGASIARAATKSGRYVGEMNEIAATQEAAGLPAELFRAMGIVYEGLSATRLARGNPEEVGQSVPLDDVLDALQI
jgi:3-hydroxyisobutyrate dehydrogenase-like beta-hydroxyacid dehydrogenase